MRAFPTAFVPALHAPAQRGIGRGGNNDTQGAEIHDGLAPSNNWTATAEACGPAAYTRRPPLAAVIGFAALWASAFKCAKGVGWKGSTQAFMLHAAEEVYRLAVDLQTGKYREGRTHEVHITYPKRRLAIAIAFRDRVFQRSLNDNILYPFMTRSLIWANFACQHGKGTDAARAYYAWAYRKAYRMWGEDFAVVTIDFKNYYGTMRHDIVNAQILRRVPRPFADWAIRTLERQYSGAAGYNPGSQMVQIAGICYLDSLDHFAKERLGVRLYAHYMDDIHAFMPRSEAAGYIEAMRREAAKLGLAMHTEKTRILDARDGAVFLGFWHRLGRDGRVVVTRDPKRVKEIRRSMRRRANKEARGEIRRGTFAASYKCIAGCIAKGNTRGLPRRMDRYFKSLQREMETYERVA